MTTRVHIVNFGPNAVSVKPEPNKVVGATLYAQQSTDIYVYGDQTITVAEVLPATPEDDSVVLPATPGPPQPPPNIKVKKGG